MVVGLRSMGRRPRVVSRSRVRTQRLDGSSVGRVRGRSSHPADCERRAVTSPIELEMPAKPCNSTGI